MVGINVPSEQPFSYVKVQLFAGGKKTTVVLQHGSPAKVLTTFYRLNKTVKRMKISLVFRKSRNHKFSVAQEKKDFHQNLSNYNLFYAI